MLQILFQQEVRMGLEGTLDFRNIRKHNKFLSEWRTELRFLYNIHTPVMHLGFLMPRSRISTGRVEAVIQRRNVRKSQIRELIIQNFVRNLLSAGRIFEFSSVQIYFVPCPDLFFVQNEMQCKIRWGETCTRHVSVASSLFRLKFNKFS